MASKTCSLCKRTYFSINGPCPACNITMQTVHGFSGKIPARGNVRSKVPDTFAGRPWLVGRCKDHGWACRAFDDHSQRAGGR